MNSHNHLLRPLLAGLFVLVLATSANAATLTVGPAAGPGIDYTSIQAAVNAAAAGDTILVQSGTYYENVNVNKALILQGVDSGSGLPVVDAGGSNSAITLSADGCTLQGFVARGSGFYPEAGIKVTSNGNTISGNTATSNGNYGISLTSSNGNTISGNTATGNNVGIDLSSSSGNTISGNTATSNGFGIVLDLSNGNTISGNTATGNGNYGISLYYSNGNTISGNTATGSYYGIFLFYNCNSNTISGNTVTGNYYGISLYSNCNSNTITGNTATGSYYYGIYLSSSSGNIIFLNTFDNTHNAWSDGANYWNATAPQTGHSLTGLLGNIWSDYNGTDCDGDGIGDTPYLIEGGPGKDYHPIGGMPCSKKLLCISGYKHDGCTGLPLSGWKIKVNNSTQEWNETTDSNGFWRVCNLENDTYTISEVPQSGWAQTYPAGFHSETLAGVNITNINFTNQKMYCISGYKKDNCTGAPLPGWNIILQNATGTTSQLTGPDGKYVFCNLKPGDYTITEEARAGYAAVSVVANPVTLNCSNITNQNFTNQKLLCISGTKFNNCTKQGLDGWTIMVKNSTGDVAGQNVTSNGGKWQVCNLLPGIYTVSEVPQAGWKNVTPLDQPVTLGCTNLTGVDFYNDPLLCISGTKFNNCTKQGLDGWTIMVKNSTGDVAGQNVTSNGGKWQVCNLLPGIYTVSEVPQAGWKNVTPLDQPVTLGCTNLTGVDFYNDPLLCINGTKTDEHTGLPLAGWTVNLLQKPRGSNGSGALINTTTTDSDGKYSFCGLESGNYTVCELIQDGWKNVTDECIDVELECENKAVDFKNIPKLCINGSKISNCTGEGLANWTIELKDEAGALIDSKKTDANGDYSFSNLEPGNYTVCELLQAGWKNVTSLCIPVTLDTDNSEDNDFRNDPPVCISGRKINDCTDEGIAGWKIFLYDALGNRIGDAVTDRNGGYSFCNLTQGIYYVCEEEREGWTAVHESTGPSNSTSGSVTCNMPWCDDNCVCVNLGCDGAVVDFRNIPESLCINGSKINNCTGGGLSGWGIYLYDADGKNIAATQTDRNGRYSFCSLPPGQYRVCEEEREGYTPVAYINQSGASCLPEDCSCEVCNNCIPVILDCESSENNNFENIPPLSIRGKVIDDCTGLALQGWTVKLYDDKGVQLTTRTTGADGSYAFISSTTGGLKLKAGTLYSVCEVVQGGWTPVTYHANNSSPAMSNEYCIPVVLDCGDTEVEDFENIPSLLISGHEFNHCTGAGLDGWTVHLKDGAGNILETTTTDGAGYYEFSGLEPGWYTVCEDSIPEGWTSFRDDPSPAMSLPGASAAPADCERPKCIVVSLDYCEDSIDNDFENIPPFCINGTVYNNSTAVVGFPIKIENSDGSLVQSIPTDANGEYSFCGLKAGTYTVCVNKPGWTADKPCVIVYLDCMDEVNDFEVYKGRSNIIPAIEQPAIALDDSRGAVDPGAISVEPPAAAGPDIGGDEQTRPASGPEIA